MAKKFKFSDFLGLKTKQVLKRTPKSRFIAKVFGFSSKYVRRG